MNLRTKQTLKEWCKRFVSSFVVFAIILVSFGPVFPVKRAEAIPAVITGGIGTIQETISAGLDAVISGLTSSLNMKEIVLDGIAWALINEIISQLSQSIVTWINSGFQGSPAFITDLEGFLTNVADKVAGDYIWGSGLSFLCSPFKLNIQIALDIQYRQARRGQVQCTLSGVLNNVQNFAEAPINDWDSWFQVALKPENNVYGAVLLAQAGLNNNIASAQGSKKLQLTFNKGFLSKEKCEGLGGREKCTVVTPGSTIEHQLNTALDLPSGRLQVADEINEILGALFSQLAKQAISGAGGLLGLSNQGSSGGQGSYFDQINTDSASAGFVKTGNPIEDSIQFEREWLSLHREGVALIEDAQDHVDNSCMAGTEIPRNLERELSDLELAITRSNLSISSLTAIARRYTTAPTAEVRAAVMNEYLTLQSQGLLHNESTNYVFKLIDLADIRTAVNAYKESVNDYCRRQNETGAGA